MSSPSKNQSKEYYNAHWKITSVILACSIGLSFYFGIWVFIGGFWVWWAAGYMQEIPFGLLRPIAYGGWAFLIACLCIDIYCTLRLIQRRGKGRYRFAYASAIIILIAGTVAFINFGGGSFPTQNTPLIVLAGPDPSTGVVIDCFTPASQGNLVMDWNKNGSSTVTQAFDTRGNGNTHCFIIDGLQPNTTYEYRLVANSSSTQSVPAGNDQPRYFKTAPSNTTNGFSFLSISDIHSNFVSPLVTRMAAEKTDLIIEAGDISDNGALASDWDGYFSTASPLFAGPNASAPVKILLPVIGNHETNFFGKPSFDRYFHGIGNGTGSPYYYRVDVGNVHFIALDIEWGLESFTSDQATWFNSTLASINPSDWIIVMTHCPVFSSGDDGNVTGVAAKIAPLLEHHGVDLVISGHDHHYERIVHNNVTYMLTATVHPEDPPVPKIPGSQVCIWGQVMYARYVIHGNRLDLTSIYENGTIADTATIYNR